MKRNISTLKIAATYIGTVIGAGFASGQEILQFFSTFGYKGFLGLITVTIFFILFGYIILEIGYFLKPKSHLEIIKFSGGKIVGTIIDSITTFFLFGGLTTMLAGSGAIFSQQFKTPFILGTFIMTVLTAATVATGINGVINSISFVVPFLLISAIGVSIASFLKTTPEATAPITISIVNIGLLKNWFWAAILYTSYNMLTSVAVLSPLGAKAINHKSIRNGALLGGLGLGIGATSIYFALSRHYSSIISVEVPMAFIASAISSTMQIIYTIVLICEIYTTAVANLYGFAARITDTKKPNAKVIIIAISIASFIASLFGFSNLVKYLYPIVGYGGIILLICLIYAKLKLLYYKINRTA